MLFCRHYRQSRVETPSHPGGVSSAYREKQSSKQARQREKGIYTSTKETHKSENSPDYFIHHYYISHKSVDLSTCAKSCSLSLNL